MFLIHNRNWKENNENKTKKYRKAREKVKYLICTILQHNYFHRLKTTTSLGPKFIHPHAGFLVDIQISGPNDVNLQVYEGERPLAKHNKLLATFELTGFPPEVARGQHKVHL